MNREECLDWLYRLRGETYVYIQPEEWLIPMNNALDMAIKALEQEPCEDCISRQAAIDAIWDGVNMDIYTREVKECLEKLPSVGTEKIGMCKDCKYFERDSVAKVDGIPLIVAHEICSRWGSGCKTRKGGYCFLYEPQESEV